MTPQEEAKELSAKLRQKAHERGHGSMDPIWDDIFELEAHATGVRTLFTISQSLEYGKRWLELGKKT